VAEDELALVVVRAVDVGPEGGVLLDFTLLILPPGTVALLVAVAVELPWATLDGRPDTKVGPGIVYVSTLV